jgi:hypothetical protein
MVPSGKQNYGKKNTPFLLGNSTNEMAIFNSYVKLPEGISWDFRVISMGISDLPCGELRVR